DPHQQRRGPVTEWLVSQRPADRAPRRRSCSAGAAPLILLSEPAFEHRPLGREPLPYRDQAPLLEAREGRQIVVVKGSVGHVEVFRMASVGTSISGRPRRLSRHRRAHPATRTYTLRCEEPGNPSSPGALIHHSDAGSQYTSIRYTEHLDLEGIAPSIGTVGDAFDNALMESVNGLYKTECIRTTVFHPGPFRTLADVEFATAGWADWYNNRRLHG